jgi:ribonucleoside-diphosphate reductase alpha chain
MFERVAGGIPEYREIMERLDFLPNSPTLMNAGTGRSGTLSACFKFDVADAMLEGEDSIISTRAKAAAVAKWGGGVGYYFGHLRPKGSVIQSVHRKACGPVSVLKDFHGLRQLITQGGKRDLAQMGILPHDHPDIREFIHAKDNDPQGLSSFNISVSCSDSFMSATKTEGTAERELWQEMVESAWKTGDPGVYFFDAAERHNPTPWLGQLTGTNPCGEVPLLNNEPCNLGSINLGNFVDLDTRQIEWKRLAEVSRTATSFLDAILDRNTFPHPAITEAAHATRKLGLGVMGWADMLALLSIDYDSQAALDLAEEVMSLISREAEGVSLALAESHGPYPGFDEGKAGTPSSEAPRNATRTCIAPTGTIAIIAGASSGIEPHFAVEWERTTFEGIKMQEQIPVYEYLGDFVPKTAMEIDWTWHVKHQAAFQKHTDLAVSKTINLPNDATEKDISDAYLLMWELGCKGGTVFRDGCRGEQVLVPKNVEASVFSTGRKQQERRRLTEECEMVRQKIAIGSGFEGYVMVGLYGDGTPGEVFVKASKEGSTIAGLLDSWAVTFSLAIQHGVPFETLFDKFAGARYEPMGVTGNEDIPMCTSIVDFIVRWMDKKFYSGALAGSVEEQLERKKQLIAQQEMYGNDEESIGLGSGQFCPDCDKEAMYHGGCLQCIHCGWSRCG